MPGLLMLTPFPSFSTRFQTEEIVWNGVPSEGSGTKTKSHASHFNRERLVEGSGCPSAGWPRSRNANNRITGVVIAGNATLESWSKRNHWGSWEL